MAESFLFKSLLSSPPPTSTVESLSVLLLLLLSARRTGVLLLLAAGAGVDAFRQKAFNRDYSKKPFGQKIVDAFDRSGLGGIYSDINNFDK